MWKVGHAVHAISFCFLIEQGDPWLSHATLSPHSSRTPSPPPLPPSPILLLTPARPLKHHFSASGRLSLPSVFSGLFDCPRCQIRWCFRPHPDAPYLPIGRDDDDSEVRLTVAIEQCECKSRFVGSVDTANRGLLGVVRETNIRSTESLERESPSITPWKKSVHSESGALCDTAVREQRVTVASLPSLAPRLHWLPPTRKRCPACSTRSKRHNALVQ